MRTICHIIIKGVKNQIVFNTKDLKDLKEM